DSCDKIGGLAYDGNGWNRAYGHGRINAQRAVAEAGVAPFGVPVTRPANHAILTDPASLTIAALAVDLEGTITKVEFLVGTNIIGQAVTAPYATIWTNPPYGHLTMSARVSDNLGRTRESAAIAVDVVPGLSMANPA